MHALVVGATGATGKDLVEQLLNDSSCARVDIFVRRDAGISHAKLHQHIIEFDKPMSWQHLVQGDVLFSCLGTTIKAAGSKEAQWKIDYDYQYAFAKAAKENGVPCYVLVSSSGAKATSMIFYSKMKGQLEEAVKALGFERTIIFQPPILMRKNSDRGGESMGVGVVKFLNKLGLFSSQKPLPTEDLAHAMIEAAKSNRNSLTVIKAGEIGA